MDRPPFQTDMGGWVRGSEVPDVKARTLEGKEVSLRDYVQGATLLFFLNSADGGIDAKSLEYIERLSRAYRDQGLQVFAVDTLSTRADFDRWLAKNKGRFSFPLLFDPSGPLPPESTKPRSEWTQEDMQQMAEEWRAAADASVPGQLVNIAGLPPSPPGMVRTWGLPGLPLAVVFDAEEKLVGAVGVGGRARPDAPMRTMPEDSRGRDGLGNLLLIAGVEPRPQDAPEKVYTLQMVQEYRDRMAAERARQTASLVPLLEVGAMAPDFVTVDAGGKSVTLSDYRGKVVLLDFWATWCGPCIASMPHMQTLAQRYKDQGLVVLGSGTEDAPAALKTWIRRNQEKYPDILFAYDAAGREPQSASKSKYGVRGLPTHFVIDRDGRVVGRSTGLPANGDTSKMEYYLSRAGIEVPQETLKRAEELRAQME
jgi:peroxiredoxin